MDLQSVKVAPQHRQTAAMDTPDLPLFRDPGWQLLYFEAPTRGLLTPTPQIHQHRPHRRCLPLPLHYPERGRARTTSPRLPLLPMSSRRAGPPSIQGRGC